ncbi:S9 family peptidase [Paracidobacterium acidisoli]|nr:prolyl oligopeptidase family serine peptidase [Paracidobacterium acidisoli]MBT9332029.1 prolyl oligopeptidase family serine peptidase [Paracidobacterium acidisoli]
MPRARLVVLCVMMSSLAAWASVDQPTVLKQFANQTSLQFTFRIALSPDGNALAYEVARPARTGQRSQIDLRIVDLNTKRRVTICCEVDDATQESWSPSGRFLAFVRGNKPEELGGEEKDSKLMIYDTVERKLSVVENARPSSTGIYQYPRWIGDGAVLITRRCENEDTSTSGQGVTVYDSLPAKRDSSSVPGKDSLRDDHGRVPRVCLDRVDLKSGTKKTLIEGRRITWPEVSPDGKYLAVAEYEGTLQTELTSRYQIHFIDLRTGADVRMQNSVFLFTSTQRVFNWLPDSSGVAFPTLKEVLSKTPSATYRLVRTGSWGTETEFEAKQTDRSVKFLPATWSLGNDKLTADIGNELITWDVSTGRIQQVAAIPAGLYRYEAVPTVAPNGDVIMVAKRDSDSAAVVLGYNSLSGEITTKVVLDEQPVYQWGSALLAQGGKSLLLAVESLNRSAEVVSVDWSGHEQRITDGDNRPDSMQAQYTKVSWRSGNGTEIDGALLTPIGTKVSSTTLRLPMIVRIYPSEWNPISGQSFGLSGGMDGHSEDLTLVAAGYAIFFPNCPTQPGSYVSDLSNNILSGIQKVIDMGIADPNRIGLIGESAGVEAALTLLVSSRQFRAAALMDGTIDPVADYGDITGYGIQTMKGPPHFLGAPWLDSLRYIDESPVFRLDRIQAPILLFHGTKDTAVPLYLGEEIFSDLRAAGKTAQLVEYKDAGHLSALRSLDQQVDSMSRTLAWFDRYVKHGEPDRVSH